MVKVKPKLTPTQRYNLKVGKQNLKATKIKARSSEKAVQTVGRTIQNVASQAVVAATEANRQIQETERLRATKAAQLNEMLAKYNSAIKGEPEQTGNSQSNSIGDTPKLDTGYGG